MKACARFRPMIGHRPGELPAGDARALADHLAGCEACRAFAADVEATTGLVAEALLARAAQRDFAPFVDQVMARVEASRAPGVLGWLSARRRALVGLLVPALAALALIVYVLQQDGGTGAALVQVTAEGEATTVIETPDGPIVLLAPEEST